MELNKERIEKFKQHTKAVFAPFVQQIVANGLSDPLKLNLIKAIHGIIYQYTGDEGNFLQTKEVPEPYLVSYIGRKFISFLNAMYHEEMIFPSGEEDESQIVNNLLTRLVYRIIERKNPTFFYDHKEKSENMPNDFMEEESESPENLSDSQDSVNDSKGFLNELRDIREALDHRNFDELDFPEDFHEKLDET